MSFLTVQNISKRYENEGVVTSALGSISFSVRKGEFIAVMGPSGSGKSTLLHILGLLDDASSGRYEFDGIEVASYTENEKAEIRNKKIGFVFQSFNLLPKTSVYENVRLPLLYSSIPQTEWGKKTKDAISAVDLSDRIFHESSQLSGGEKQRVAIARALVTGPEVIFADEPTGNLDSVSGKTIMKILRDLNEKKGHTILLITHETYTAEHAERIIRLKDGNLKSDIKVTRRFRAEEFIK
ncbi:MAG: ABC transporter ATP-binding protein [bacterium]|nr:ABC transporter ATP-binding protein [bacterium]